MEEEQVTTQNQTGTPTGTPRAEDIATALIAALEKRQARVEGGVTKSFAEQYGIPEDEIKDILTKAKAERDSKIPEAAQQEISRQREQVNNLLIAADVRARGAAMGLVDADTAMLLISRDKIKVDDKGTVTGVEDALKSLKESKSYLFTPQPTGAKANIGGKIDTPQGAADGVEAAFLRKNPDIKI